MATFEEFLKEKSNLVESTDFKYVPHESPVETSAGHVVVGTAFYKDGTKAANILKHKDTGKYFSSGGASSSYRKNTQEFNSPAEAARHYINK